MEERKQTQLSQTFWLCLWHFRIFIFILEYSFLLLLLYFCYYYLYSYFVIEKCIIVFSCVRNKVLLTYFYLLTYIRTSTLLSGPCSITQKSGPLKSAITCFQITCKQQQIYIYIILYWFCTVNLNNGCFYSGSFCQEFCIRQIYWAQCDSSKNRDRY